VEAIIEGLKDGTLDVIATDHAPHAPEKKMRELEHAPNGIVGLETLIPICVKSLIEPGHLTWARLIEKLTCQPARVLGIDRGALRGGADADVTIIDPSTEWTIDVARFRSKSRNSPFDGWTVRGRAHAVIASGELLFER
jgi:dihydroorotase